MNFCKFLSTFGVGMLAFLCLPLQGSECHTSLIHNNWQFRQARFNDWRTAQVPGTVHTDLMAHKLIEDPYMDFNERSVQWVDKEDWEYKTSFDLNTDQRKDAVRMLVFEGIDTYTDIFLNDSLICKTDNMFRTWKLDVSNLLKDEGNTLRIYFHSPIKIDMPKYDALNYHHISWNDQSQNGGLMKKQLAPFARKAGYHYGWDWGPRLVTSGIWRPVKLISWNVVRIEDVYVRQQTTAKLAQVKETVTIRAERDCKATVTVCDKENGLVYATLNCDLQKGENAVDMNFNIKQPKLWWTNGLGDAHLYNFDTQVKAGEDSDSKNVRIGLRSLRLLNEPDSIGKEFCFELNGKRVFMKGANYIPCDIFLPRVSDSIYAQTVKDAADVNMNMMRVWGGGVYEDDRFYDLCDEYGILIWQDFMFACASYPASGQMLESIKAEARDNICRLRNHACLAIWAGNNECQDAFYNSWKKKFAKVSPEVGEQAIKEYEGLYYDALPSLCKELNPDVKYWPCSPFSDYRQQSSTKSGDFHYWAVWHSKKPIREYNTHKARFYSEYGMQSFPELESVKQFASDTTQWDIYSDLMMTHQRGGSFANGLIETYLESEYIKPNDFPSLLYVGQLMQGDAMKTAVESHRRNKGYCWGTMLWQINDCWPVASWSTRDWYGRWKGAHYMMRHAMDDILVSPIEQDGNLCIYIVNDRMKAAKGILKVQLQSMDGKVLKSFQKKVTIPENCSSVQFKESVETLFAGLNKADVIVVADFNTDKNYSANYCLLKPKDMNWCKEIGLEWNVEETANGRVVTLKCKAFVYGIFLSLPEEVNPFERNYFNMTPGEKVSVPVHSKQSTADIQRLLRVKCLNEIQ